MPLQPTAAGKNGHYALWLPLGVMLLVGVGSAQAPVPADFAITFEGSMCSGESIDTAKGTYSREINPGQHVMARYTLDSAELSRLFEMATAADLLSYPEEFTPPLAGDMTPAPRYVITIRLGGRQHTVRWTDRGSSVPEAQRLRRFVREVYAYFLTIPEVAKLPEHQTFCL